MFTRIVSTVALLLLLSSVAPARADVDPTVQQIYEATRAGHLVQAEQMIRQVLRDHPKSAKAHYVAAEVYAKAGNEVQARAEFKTAEELDPGLSFATPEAVRALRNELWRVNVTRAEVGAPTRGTSALTIVALLLAGGALIAWLFSRSRNAGPPIAPAAAAAAPPATVGAPGSAPPGTAATPVSSGSGLLGSLASGLAVGAGVAAGEELVHHVLEPDGHATLGAHEPSFRESRTDSDEPDFGVKNPGSWDDPDSGSAGNPSDDDSWN